MFLNRPKVRQVVVNGELAPGVYAKDVILYNIQQLGVQGGVHGRALTQQPTRQARAPRLIAAPRDPRRAPPR